MYLLKHAFELLLSITQDGHLLQERLLDRVVHLLQTCAHTYLKECEQDLGMFVCF